MAGIVLTQQGGMQLIDSYSTVNVEDSVTDLVLVRQFGSVTVTVVPTVRVGTP